MLEALKLSLDALMYQVENFKAEYRMYPHGDIQQADIDEAQDNLEAVQAAITKATS